MRFSVFHAVHAFSPVRSHSVLKLRVLGAEAVSSVNQRYLVQDIT